jgi:hypothetical protein
MALDRANNDVDLRAAFVFRRAESADHANKCPLLQLADARSRITENGRPKEVPLLVFALAAIASDSDARVLRTAF